MDDLERTTGEPVSGPSGSDSAGEPFHLLFVCTGNTCRSPLAELLTRKALEDRGWGHVEVRSSGVAATEGAPASRGSVRAAQRHGLELGDHRAAPLDPEIVEWADLILTMSPSHLDGVAIFGGDNKVSVITDFVQEAQSGAPAQAPSEVGRSRGVIDPIGGDDSEYEATYRQLEGLVEKVLTRLEPLVSP